MLRNHISSWVLENKRLTSKITNQTNTNSIEKNLVNRKFICRDELLRWEEKVIEAGKPHMVRQRTLNAKLRDEKTKANVIKPRKSASPFQLFVEEQKQNAINESKDWYEVKWTGLSDAEQKPYFEMANKNKAKYQ